MMDNELLNIISRYLNGEPPQQSLWDWGNDLKLFFNETPFVNIDEPDHNGQTALSLACSNPFNMPAIDSNLVDMFIRMGADINSIDHWGFTPVMHAIRSYEDHDLREVEDEYEIYMYSNRHNLLNLLSAEPILSISGNNENIFSLTKNEKLSQFFYEFENIRIERLEENLHYTKLNKLEYINRQWKKLDQAIISHNLNDVKKIIKKNPEIIHMKSKRHDSFLHVAVIEQCSYIVDYLLDLGLDQNAENCCGNTPFLLATETGNIELALKFSNDFAKKSPFDRSAINAFIGGLPSHKTDVDFEKWWEALQSATDLSGYDKLQKNIICGAWCIPKKFNQLLNTIGKKWCYDNEIERAFQYWNILEEPHATNIKNLLQNGYEINFGDSAMEININALYNELIPQVQKTKFLDILGEKSEEQNRRKI